MSPDRTITPNQSLQKDNLHQPTNLCDTQNRSLVQVASELGVKSKNMIDTLRFEEMNLLEIDLVREVSTIHCNVPCEWDSEHQASDTQIENVMQRITKKRESRCTNVLIAVDLKDRIVGFHWIEYFNSESKKFGAIHSLWVMPELRSNGIAKYLKSIGESWLREKGATEVKTKVYTMNTKMIELNKKLGYEIEMVRMCKRIKA